MKWGGSLSNEQKAARGKPNLPFLAHMLDELDMGGGWAQQFTAGFSNAGILAELGVYPQHLCPARSPKAANACEIPD